MVTCLQRTTLLFIKLYKIFYFCACGGTHAITHKHTMENLCYAILVVTDAVAWQRSGFARSFRTWRDFPHEPKSILND